MREYQGMRKNCHHCPFYEFQARVLHSKMDSTRFLWIVLGISATLCHVHVYMENYVSQMVYE